MKYLKLKAKIFYIGSILIMQELILSLNKIIRIKNNQMHGTVQIQTKTLGITIGHFGIKDKVLWI